MSSNAQQLPIAIPVALPAGVNPPLSPHAAEPEADPALAIPTQPVNQTHVGDLEDVGVAVASRKAVADTAVAAAGDARQLDAIREVLVTVSPPAGGAAGRTPVDICLVIDTSGSMGGEAKMKDATGGTEANGLSLLDVTKHACKTVASMLGAQDRLGLVEFASKARCVMGLLPMDAAGKDAAGKAIDKLEPTDCTNLWDGLHNGLETLRRGAAPGRLAHVLLLTDGCPNVVPPRGHLPMLKRYKDQHNQLSCTISTFGFGYNLDSPLLNELAQAGDGMYAFIPDSSFVGTVFTNATANLLCTMATNARLTLEPVGGAALVGARELEAGNDAADADAMDDGAGGGGDAADADADDEDKGPVTLGGAACQVASWGAQVDLGALQYGQTRDLVVRMRVPRPAGGGGGGADGAELAAPFLKVSLSYEHRLAPGAAVTREADVALALAAARKDDLPRAQALVKAFARALRADVTSLGGAAALKGTAVGALLQDVEGQVTEAFSRQDWFTRWGRHYVPALARAHALQQCNNFKDPGVQEYGGALFTQLRDVADEIFCKLPPPKPSRRPGRGGGAHRAPVNMARYNNRGNPCFAPDALVAMADGTQKRVADVRKGDVVATPLAEGGAAASKGARVLCAVRTRCAGGACELVELPGGLVVTPYHPVRVPTGDADSDAAAFAPWRFPCELGVVAERPCAFVTSFVLERAPGVSHAMLIDGVACVCLGHAFDDNEVVRHAFFGSERVVDCLRGAAGWADGLVALEPGCAVRDATTNLVVGLRVTPAAPAAPSCGQAAAVGATAGSLLAELVSMAEAWGATTKTAAVCAC